MRNTLSNKKAIVFLILYFGVYLLVFQDFLSVLIGKHFGIEMYFISSIVMDLCMVLAFVFIGLKYFTQNFQIFVENYKCNIKHILTTVGSLFLTNLFLAQLIYFFLPTVQADNQINHDLFPRMLLQKYNLKSQLFQCLPFLLQQRY